MAAHTTANTTALSEPKDYMLLGKFWLYYWSEYILYDISVKQQIVA